LTKIDLTIQYATPLGKSDVQVAYMTYTLDPSSTTNAGHAKDWVARLLDRAYGVSQRQKRIKVLINPYGGAGKAAKWFTRDIEPILRAAHCEVDVERTSYMGHAVEIAEKIDIDAYDVIASCSGDGLPHEVFNGLARKPNATEALRRVAVVQLPCGTGNAMSWNLNGTKSCSMAALMMVKGIRTPLDLVSVTQGQKRIISFLSQAIGIVAETDLGTDNIRWMGSARFTYGFFVRLLGKTVYPCDIAIQTEIADKAAIKAHYSANVCKHHKSPKLASTSTSTLSCGITDDGDTSPNTSSPTSTGLPALKYGTVQSPLPPGWTLTPYPTLGNFYSGNMAIMAEATPIFPASLPSDGLLDLVTIDGTIGRLKTIASLLAVENGTFFDMPHVNMRKVSAYRVVPRFGKWAKPSSANKMQEKSRVGRVMAALGMTGGNSKDNNNRDGGYISVDGEKMPFEPFQVEVHRGLGTVLSRSGFVYEADGPAGWDGATATATATANTNTNTSTTRSLGEAGTAAQIER
jgi:sphingosine kinase